MSDRQPARLLAVFLTAMRALRFVFIASLLASAVLAARARTFEVVVYNVENLFDVDGVSLFEDYAPERYTPAHLARKLENISAVLQRYGEGRGPEIVLLNEIEVDQTPESTVAGIDAFLRRTAQRRVRDLLAAPRLPREFAGLPAHVWLLKQLRDDGLAPYHVAVGEYRPDPGGRVIAQTNVVLSRFPILEQRTHHTEGARGIQEVVVGIDGHRLYLFNNHWKSGASDPSSEPLRIANARVLRERLDGILRDDPHADVILGGDFNSQYNQKQRYPRLPVAAINDVLGSQGDELALREPGGPDLYNLWFELPPERRGSDVFREEWGTLMQMLITRGLHDFRGVQYVDNSFGVGAYPGLNADVASGLPVRWQFADGGAGFSDHFPIHARFRIVPDGRTDVWLDLVGPSRTATGPAEGVPVALPLEAATVVASLARDVEFRTAANAGKLFRVRGRVSSLRPFRIALEGSTGGEIMLWVRDPAVREPFFARHQLGDALEVVGELSQFRGDWQLVVPERAVPGRGD